MLRATRFLSETRNRFRNPGFLRDTTFVAAASIFSGVGSLVFWKLITLRFSLSVLGLTSTAISSAVFLGMLATLGMVTGFARFLSGQTPAAQLTLIRFAYALCLATGLLIGLIFVAGRTLWASTLFPIGDALGFPIVFLLLLLSFCVVSLNAGIIQATKRTHFLLIQSLAINIIQITGGWLIPVYLGETGVLLCYMLPIFLVAIGGYFIIPYLMNNQAAKIDLRSIPIFSFLQYSVGNQVFTLIWQFPSFIFPLITLHLLGAEKNGLLAIAWYGCTFVGVIPNSAMSMLLVYGSDDEAHPGRQLANAVFVSLALLTPMVLAIVVLAPWLLLFFGTQYEQAALLLRLLILGNLPLTINGLFFTIKRIRKQVGYLNLLALIQIVILVVLCGLLVPFFGLDGIGLGWLAGQAIFMLGILPLLWMEYRRLDPNYSDNTMNINTIRFSLSNRLGSSYTLFPLLKNWPPVRQLIVTKNTGICIEAPARSANSFAVNVFSLWNPDVSIAHHIHVPMQAVYAAKWHIPCIVLLRDPIDVLSSLLIVDLKLSMTVTIKSYINFYQRIKAIRGEIVVAHFKEVTTNFQAVIEKVNTHYGTTFYSDTLSHEQVNELFAQMEQNTLAHDQPPLLVPVPKDYKEKLKFEVKERLKKHPLFEDANQIYLEWCAYL